MANAPRTPDDGRNERQRQSQEQDTRKERVPDDGRNERQRQRATGEEQKHILEEKPFDFIERTRPEDRLNVGGGQQTRDNVNPAIPSAEPGTGDIVDPRTLGMESIAGVAPPAAANQPEQWPSLGLDHTKDANDQVQEAENRQRQLRQSGAAPGQQHTDEQDLAMRNHLPSINEPPGSNITTGDAGPAELPPLVLEDISPDAMVVGSGTFPLTVTGSGFVPDCVVVFEDAEVPTSFVSPTELHADCPVAATAGVVDVEVHRGEDMSDVLQFEFTAVMREGREKKPPARKPSKGKKGKR
jgi:IPT/TIG domain